MAPEPLKKHDLKTDDKGRLTLGKSFACQHFIIEQIDEGEFILKKAILIPERELWIHKNQKAKQALMKGLEQAKQGKIQKNAIDIDTFDTTD